MLPQSLINRQISRNFSVHQRDNVQNWKGPKSSLQVLVIGEKEKLQQDTCILEISWTFLSIEGFPNWLEVNFGRNVWTSSFTSGWARDRRWSHSPCNSITFIIFLRFKTFWLWQEFVHSSFQVKDKSGCLIICIFEYLYKFVSWSTHQQLL